MRHPLFGYPVYETCLWIDTEEIYDLAKLGLRDLYQQILMSDGFVNTQKRKDFTGIRALCIGKQTAAEAAKFGFDTVISDTATIDSMIEKVYG